MADLRFPLPPWPAPLPHVPWLADTAWGPLWLYPDDLIGRTLLGVQGDRDVREGRSPARADGHFWDGDLLLPLYDECARPGTTVVVVGANYGQDALYCAAKGASVLAVEAQRDLYELLLQTAALQRHTRIHPLSWAAYDTPGYFGTADYDPTNLGGMPFRRLDGVTYVNGGPVDRFVAAIDKPVTLLAVDAQGCDLRALKGLTSTIREHRPTIVFEFERDLAALHGDTWDTYHAWMHNGMPHVYDWVESATHRNNYIGRPR